MRPSTIYYTTPDAVILQLDKANPTVSPNPDNAAFNDLYANVSVYCAQASSYITQVTGRVFVPYIQTRDYYHSDIRERGLMRYGRLTLEEDLLSVTSITWADATVNTADYLLLPVNTRPCDSVRFSPQASLPFHPSDITTKCSITGTWGYVTNMADLYTTVDASVTLANASITSLTVADASLYPVLSYVACESEMMLITARNTTTDVLTVTRGVNGTTAVAHSAQALRRVNIVPAIALAATQLVAYLYQNRTSSGAIQLPDGSVLFDKLPLAVKDTLEMYTRRVWSSVPTP